ncbi:NUDIX domain-containing protein [Candidatus Uhrbacteria bacterium]|jgi:mutator protein MutT|nr:NUDIX domain-containing protein [Candidatus Uhrbacteria bacterium]
MTKELPIIEVDVAVAFAKRDGKILLIQRKDTEGIWDKKWEFPGGKIEEGESKEAAMIRELREETGLEVKEQVFLGNHVHDWVLSEKIMRVDLHIFKCDMKDGDVEHEQHSAYQTHWVTPKEAATYDLLEANQYLINKFMHELT